MYVGIRLRQSQLWFLNFYIPRLTLNKSQYKRIADAKEKLSCTSRFFFLFTSKLDLNLRKKLVKCYVWSMALYGAETWTLRTTDLKRLESFEMWCWRRMEKISWTDHVRNE